MKVRIYYDGEHIYLDSLELAQEWARRHNRDTAVYSEDTSQGHEHWRLDEKGEVTYHEQPVFMASHGTHWQVDVTVTPFTLPVKDGGTVDSVGWDIPSYWILDSAGVLWANTGGHGGALRVCDDPRRIVSEFEGIGDDEGANDFRRLMGLKVPRPAWMSIALNAGWKPPEGWKDPEVE